MAAPSPVQRVRTSFARSPAQRQYKTVAQHHSAFSVCLTPELGTSENSYIFHVPRSRDCSRLKMELRRRIQGPLALVALAVALFLGVPAAEAHQPLRIEPSTFVICVTNM